MNTTSESRIKSLNRAWSSGGRGFVLAVVLSALGACIQGPWDFYPDNPPPFHGVYLNGYALSGRPLEKICFEKMLDLKEEATAAFAFYDNADVRVTGRFSGTVKTLTLSALPQAPNCFQGDTAALVEKGQAYAMDARFTWDSAGHTVNSRLTSTAMVPTDFSMHRTAAAPSLAKTGGIPNNIFTLEFFARLPPNVQQVMVEEYADTLGKLQSDSAALAAYFKTNGAKIQARLTGLLENDKFTYHEGDTLYYLNGALNTLSHYFSCDRSSDVNAVLITHRFDPESERPETRFDSFLGLKPDSDRYYYPGDIRRLLVYPDAKSEKGWNLLDSMGVVNTWFHTRRNRLYFYGFEQAYMQYLSTTTGGGGSDPDARVKPKFNVLGGQGIFAGGIPDSFDLYIRTDSLTKSYSLPAVHASFCHKEGWFSNQDCRKYYRSYCADKDWVPADCRQDAVQACMEAELKDNPDLKAACSPVAEEASQDSSLAKRAAIRFCVEENFPGTNSACAAPKSDCQEAKGTNSCKQAMWDYCLDNLWQPDVCGLGLVSYCKDRPRLSETLCRHADDYCRAHPGETLCK